MKPGKKNVLAVETFAPTEKDLGINWVDWNPCPPDKDMGLVGRCQSGGNRRRSRCARPWRSRTFEDDTLSTADLTVYAELHNATDQPGEGRGLRFGRRSALRTAGRTGGA